MYIEKLIAVILLLLLIVSATAVPSPTKGKLILQYGFDVPTTNFVRANIADMEKVPFDGITISDGLGWRAWSRNKLAETDIAKTVENLKATRFKKFKHNLIPLITYFPDDQSIVDWFEPEWSNIAYNAALIARSAKQGKCAGIVFDAEQYGNYKMWNYEGALKSRPFEEVSAKVKERGREFIRAINKEFRNPVILVLWAYELPIVYPGGPGELPAYPLLMSFLDGIIDAATPGTVLVDGYEYAYGYISQKAFMAGRKMIKDTARNKISSVPEAFDKHVQYGCPVYPDMWSSQILSYDIDNPENNLFTPEYFRTALYNAMTASDKYVWVYNEHLRWFSSDPRMPANAPKPYIDAIDLARKGPAPGDHPDKITWPEVKLTLPVDNWGFVLDPTLGSASEACTKAGYDDSAWQQVKIGEVPSYTGKAWYRYKFTAPLLGNNMRAFLTIPTADEFAKIWLNGEYIGNYDINRHGPYGFYVVEITKAYKPGADNVLVLQMDNREGGSGINKPLKITESGKAWMK
jgi:hypothetical protein